MKQTHISAKSGEKKTSGKSDPRGGSARNQPPIQCPECTSQRVWRDGMRRTGHGDVQRYICRECGRRFSEASKPLQKPSYGSLNRTYAISLDRQICVSEQEAKNLARVETRQKRAAGATKLDLATIKGKIFGFTWWMKKQGYAESTIKLYTKLLKLLATRGANIFNPESVKEVMARQKWRDVTRHNVICAYTLFLKTLGCTWEKPICKPTRKLPFIPIEQEIDALIAGCGKKTAAFLQLLKETAMRSGEAGSLLWTDIDFERRTITLNSPEKHGNPGIFKVSSRLIGMLNDLPKTSERVFGDSSADSRRISFYWSRKRLAKKLQNPRLMRITFHTLRHWKATMLYHQTKDILYVKEFLGHKQLDTTTLYIQLDTALFKETTDEFTVKVASEPDEIKKLLEVGFNFVCEKNDLLYFKKRK